MFEFREIDVIKELNNIITNITIDNIAHELKGLEIVIDILSTVDLGLTTEFNIMDFTILGRNRD